MPHNLTWRTPICPKKVCACTPEPRTWFYNDINAPLTCTACLKLVGSAESNMTAATSSWARSRQGSSGLAALLACGWLHGTHSVGSGKKGGGEAAG
jgi:hypothetical protein